MMLEYLIDYGIQKQPMEFEELDINDRMELQHQINSTRKSYLKLLNLYNDIQGKFIDANSELSQRTKDLISNSDGQRGNKIFNTDQEYIKLEAKIDALKAGMGMVQSQIDYYKSDLRILNSVFYNKF